MHTKEAVELDQLVIHESPGPSHPIKKRSGTMPRELPIPSHFDDRYGKLVTMLHLAP